MQRFFSQPSLAIRFGLAGVCGLLLAMAFPKFSLSWLAWIAPGLLLMLSFGQTGWTAFRIGYLAGLVQFSVGFYWLLLIPKSLVGIFAWMIVAMLMSIYIGMWTWFCWRCFPKDSGKQKSPSGNLLLSLDWKRRSLWAFICATAWVTMEMGIARIFNGFPYSLGLSQFKLIPLIQIASVTGVHGVSFLVVWTSVSVACAMMIAMRESKAISRIAREIAIPCIALTGVLFFGNARLNSVETARGYLKIALVQPGIPQSIIWDTNERTNRLNKLVELSVAALEQHPDLLVWPEAALPENMMGRNRETQNLITGLVRSNNVWMIFGGIDTAVRKNASGAIETVRFNTAFFVNPAGELVSRYHKRKLVMLGEYNPVSRWLSFMNRSIARTNRMEAGDKIIHFEMSNPLARISPLICFEDTFSYLARAATDFDIDFLLNLTNNGWFGKSASQWQHAVNALFRAVENDVPLVRCTNNGLTCWIDSRGRLHDVYFPDSMDIYQPGFKIIKIPLRTFSKEHPTRTIYNRYGDFFGWVCVAIVFATTAWSFGWRRNKS